MSEANRVKCFRNAEEIAEYIGESQRVISQLVIDEGLPAWKRNGTGPWRALNVDLDQWMLYQSKKYKPRAHEDALFKH